MNQMKKYVFYNGVCVIETAVECDMKLRAIFHTFHALLSNKCTFPCYLYFSPINSFYLS